MSEPNCSRQLRTRKQPGFYPRRRRFTLQTMGRIITSRPPRKPQWGYNFVCCLRHRLASFVVVLPPGI